MRVYTAFELFHTKPMACDPDLPYTPAGPKYLTREELENGKYDPCEVCFPDWNK